MREVKVHIRHVILSFYNNKPASDIAKKMYSFYVQGFRTNRHNRNRISKFISGNTLKKNGENSTRRPSGIDQDALREMDECNCTKSIDIQQITICFQWWLEK